MINANIKRGLLTGLVFSLVGFLLPVMVFFMAHDPTSRKILFIPCMPAEYILGHFMTTWEMGHGGILYIPFINTLLYGLLGCVIGTLFDIRRYALHCCVIIGILAVVSISIISTRESYKRKQSIEAMKVGYEHRVKIDPTEVHSLFWLGVHHFSRTHNYQEAKNYFEQILTLSPREQYTLLYLVIILKSQGQDEQAKQMYTRFLDTQPDLKNDCTLFNLNNDARTKLGLSRLNWEIK